MGFVRNWFNVDRGVDLWMRQARELPTQQFRVFVWTVFLRILRETPQFSGKAVANWNLSIGAPNFDWNDDYGDELEWDQDARARGDQRWIRVARDRARPIKDRIRSRDKVFISNGVRGDTDNGKSVEAYLESLQDPGYAARKLRVVNQPYENAQESVVVVATQFLSKGIALPRVGGEDWQ